MELDDLAGSETARRMSRRGLLRGLTAGVAGTAGALTLSACGIGTGSAAGLSTGRSSTIANELAFDEQQHVKLLRTTLGANAIAKPAINLSSMNSTLSNFLALARGFEDLGVSAYGGAIPILAVLDGSANKDIVATASRILAGEAYHAGNIRLQVAEWVVSVATMDSQDIIPPPGGTNYFPLDSTGLTVVRTPAQVAAIIKPYFPSGTNGTFPPVTATDYLNFALNLQYLEAEFYTYATTGRGIDSAGVVITGTGTQGVTTGGQQVQFV